MNVLKSVFLGVALCYVSTSTVSATEVVTKQGDFEVVEKTESSQETLKVDPKTVTIGTTAELQESSRDVEEKAIRSSIMLDSSFVNSSHDRGNIVIPFRLAATNDYSSYYIEIYDKNYSRVAYEQERFPSGYGITNLQLTWDASNMPAGTYYVRYKTYGESFSHYYPFKINMKSGEYFKSVQSGSQTAIGGNLSKPFSAWKTTKVVNEIWYNYKELPAEIRLEEMYIGEEAAAIVHSENRVNDTPSPNQQWILMNYHVKNIGTEAFEANDIIHQDFFYTSKGASLAVSDFASFAGERKDQGIYDVELYPGASSDVWIGILVPKSIGFPYLKLNLENDTPSWLNTHPNYKYVNSKPVITTSNTTINVGDKFSALNGVTAKDTEDGNITSKIQVVSNNVNTSKPGKYTVKYQVTDSSGVIVTKERIITVNNMFVHFTANSIHNVSSTITGKGLSGATVKAFVGSKQIGNTVTVNSAGNYSITIPKQSTGATVTINMTKSGYTTAQQKIVVKSSQTNTQRTKTTDIYKYDVGKGNYLTYINGRGYSQFVYLNKSGNYAFTPSSWMKAAGLTVTMPTSTNKYTMTVDNSYLKMHTQATNLLNKLKNKSISLNDAKVELAAIQSLEEQQLVVSELVETQSVITKAAPKKTITTDIYKYDAGKGKYKTYINDKGYSQFVYLNTSGNYAFTPSSWMKAAGLTVTMPTSSNGYKMYITNSYISKYNQAVSEINKYMK